MLGFYSIGSAPTGGTSSQSGPLAAITATANIAEGADGLVASNFNGGIVTGTSNIVLGAYTLSALGSASTDVYRVPSSVIRDNGRVTPPTRALPLTGATFKYIRGSMQDLILYNPGASAITVTVTGSNASAVYLKGMAGRTFDTSTGMVVNVPPYQFVYVKLDACYNYLAGNINITTSVAGVVSAAIFSAF